MRSSTTRLSRQGQRRHFRRQGRRYLHLCQRRRSDVINDTTNHNSAPDAIDRLKFTDLNAADVELSRSGNDLLIKVLSTGAVITVTFAIRGGLTGPTSARIHPSFAGAKPLAARDSIKTRLVPRYRTDATLSIRKAIERHIEGGKGDDIIYSGYQGASGNDTFVYSRERQMTSFASRPGLRSVRPMSTSSS